MHVIWSKSIKTSHPWEPDYFGLFYKQEKGVSFFFKDRSSLCAMSENDCAPKTIFTCCGEERLSLPRKWSIIANCDNQYLLFSQNTGINLRNNAFLHSVPSQVQRAYLETVRPEKYYEEASYPLGEYIIHHKGQCGYMCTKHGSQLWDFAGQAYLYTDMTRWDNRLLFGTAGNSGYFYVLDIDNGKPVATIKTGGTTSYVQKNTVCYLLSNTTYAQLLCVDIATGRTLSQCDIPGIATSNSRLSIEENHIHTITFEYSRKKLAGAIWTCIEI